MNDNVLRKSKHKTQLFFVTDHTMHKEANIPLTFLVGECITGAGGEGGPLGIFLLILKHLTTINQLDKIESLICNIHM